MSLTTMPKPATRAQVHNRSTMKALVYLAAWARRPWKISQSRKSPRRPMPSSKSRRRPFAAPTCTSSKATSQRVSRAAFWAMKASASSMKVGPAVTVFKPGDHVLISCVSACGKCEYCRKQMYLALHDRRLDPRKHHRRHAGRVRPYSLCGYESLSNSRRRRRRSAGDAQRYPADRFRVRRTQRQGRAGKHRRDRRRRARSGLPRCSPPSSTRRPKSS